MPHYFVLAEGDLWLHCSYLLLALVALLHEDGQVGQESVLEGGVQVVARLLDTVLLLAHVPRPDTGLAGNVLATVLEGVDDL